MRPAVNEYALVATAMRPPNAPVRSTAMRRPMYALAGGVPCKALVICRTPMYGANSGVGTGTCAAAYFGETRTTRTVARVAAPRMSEDRRGAIMSSPFAPETPRAPDL